VRTLKITDPNDGSNVTSLPSKKLSTHFQSDQGTFIKRLLFSNLIRGTRACVGRNLAFLELQIIIASIMRRYDIVLADPDQCVRVSNLRSTFLSLTRSSSLRRARASSENPLNVRLASSDEMFDASFLSLLIPLHWIYILCYPYDFSCIFHPYVQVIVIQHCKSYHLAIHHRIALKNSIIDVGIFTHS
jgi:hypothetical protein